MQHEYVVVGAGSAGCAVACRLAQGGARVALLALVLIPGLGLGSAMVEMGDGPEATAYVEDQLRREIASDRLLPARSIAHT